MKGNDAPSYLKRQIALGVEHTSRLLMRIHSISKSQLSCLLTVLLAEVCCAKRIQ